MLLAGKQKDHPKVQNIEDRLHEVGHETERRSHPFARSVSDCQRRYKSMNSLRTSLPPPRHCFYLG
jgi:hypothetical protein